MNEVSGSKLTYMVGTNHETKPITEMKPVWKQANSSEPFKNSVADIALKQRGKKQL